MTVEDCGPMVVGGYPPSGGVFDGPAGLMCVVVCVVLGGPFGVFWELNGLAVVFDSAGATSVRQSDHYTG